MRTCEKCEVNGGVRGLKCEFCQYNYDARGCSLHPCPPCPDCDAADEAERQAGQARQADRARFAALVGELMEHARHLGQDVGHTYTTSLLTRSADAIASISREVPR